MNTSIAALVLPEKFGDLTFAGMTLLTRARRTLARLGIDRVAVAAGAYPFKTTADAETVVVLSAATVIQPAALAALLRDSRPADGEAALVTDATQSGCRFLQVSNRRVTSVQADGNAASLNVVLLSRGAVDLVRQAPTLRDALHRLASAGTLNSVSVGPRFCARIDRAGDVPSLERRYLRHTNGGDGEGVFTRNIRTFSVPLTRTLLRIPRMNANAVTIGGLLLALCTGVAFAHGSYAAGILGALLYFASMVCDCSDGEVARATLGDSAFGAWLETATDYLSYFIVLAGIVWGDGHEGLCHHSRAAIVAAAASIAIVLLVAYQRAQTASANPGGFDDALAEQLKHGTVLQRFAGWSRQLIKRSFFAHLLLFQALIGHVRALTEIWAYGALGALVLVIGVHFHLLRTLRVGSPEHLAPANS